MRYLGVLAVYFLLICVSSAHALDLPAGSLIEYPAAGSDKDELVIILSGDGGWADLDRSLGEIITARGYAVLGFDCFKYFNKTRSPDETTHDLQEVITHYLTLWHKKRVVLVGFSFGAAVTPFVLARLPEAELAKISLVVLLSSANYANWEIHWGDWLNDKPHDSARPVLPEMAKFKMDKMLCIYGTEEGKDFLCPALPPHSAEIIELPGGHHFDQNYDRLASLILERVPH